MDLLKQISEDIKSYHNFVYSLVEKIEQFEETLSQEKRLGLYETPYYQNDTPGAAGNQNDSNDSVDFEPQDNVPKGQQPEGPPKGTENKVGGRIQLMYDPTSGKVTDAKQAQGMHTPPASGYVVANAQQLDAALKHIESIDKELADKIVAGNVQVFVPQNPSQSNTTSQRPAGGGMNKINMDPSRLAAAHQAANNMSLTR